MIRKNRRFRKIRGFSACAREKGIGAMSVFESRLGNERFREFWKALCAIADLEEDSLIAVPVCATCESGIKTAGQLVRTDTQEVFVM